MRRLITTTSLINSTAVRRSLLLSPPPRPSRSTSSTLLPRPFHSFSSDVRRPSVPPLPPKHNNNNPAFSSSSILPVVRSLSTTTTSCSSRDSDAGPLQDEVKDEGVVIEEWEKEEEVEPEIGDGGDGGGIVLQNVPWGERVLSIAREVLNDFGNDMELFAFKTSPRGYIYVRLDKISNEYGCPSMEEIESYSRQYNKRLEEEGSKGVIPNDLALEVSSPGAERILRVPDDLNRFSDFAMTVFYVEEDDAIAKSKEKSGVFLLDSINTDAGNCTWKLADVRENRSPLSKGRPLSAKRKQWRLKLLYQNLRKVTLYLGGLSD